jgi:hypothetical protein
MLTTDQLANLPDSQIWPRSFRYFRSSKRLDAKTKAARFIVKIDPLALNIRVNTFAGEEMVAVNHIGLPKAASKSGRTKHFRVMTQAESQALNQYRAENPDATVAFESITRPDGSHWGLVPYMPLPQRLLDAMDAIRTEEALAAMPLPQVEGF